MTTKLKEGGGKASVVGPLEEELFLRLPYRINNMTQIMTNYQFFSLMSRVLYLKTFWNSNDSPKFFYLYI